MKLLPVTLSVEMADAASFAAPAFTTPKTIVGYCWPWTARAGERVDFKVSTFAAGDYSAELVRIICGDGSSGGIRFKEEPVPAAFAGTYPGRHQPTYLGSFVWVKAEAPLDNLASFTIQTMVFPTRLAAAREQHLISRWDAQQRRGWALLIDEQGRVVFRAGGDAGTCEAIVSRRLTEHRWYLVVASVDADLRRIDVTVECRTDTPAMPIAEPLSQVTEHYPEGLKISQQGAVLFAACASGIYVESEPKPMHCFNGRLDRVRLAAGVLDIAAARSQCAPEIRAAHPSTIGFWDFAADMGGIEVRDLSSHAMHGMTVNAPMRAVTGVDWDGSTNDWRQAPQHYSAIHFHDDDIYDAQWQTDFHFHIPNDLRSGIYAARLRQGESEDYVPFFVVPPKGKTTAPVALLLPTANYTAYTNVTTVLLRRATVLHEGPDGVLSIRREGVSEKALTCDPAHLDFLLKHVSEFGAGLYGRHSDRTLRTSASQKHPNLSIKPKGMNWTLVADTYLTDWLEHKNIPYDVITDEVLHREGVELLQDYRAVMTGNHPEYYSARMLDAVSAYLRLGGRWMYLGGNGFYWVSSFHAQLPGLMEVRKSPAVGECERRHAFDGVNGGLWRDNGRAPQQLMGVGTSAVTLSSACAYRRLPDSYDPRANFIFKGVENEVIGDFGLIGGGAAGQEVDRIGFELGTPRHALHLARADRMHATHPMDGEPVAAADIVFFEGPKGGAVFSVGSMAWVGALGHNGYENNVSRITENVLRRFMDAVQR